MVGLQRVVDRFKPLQPDPLPRNARLGIKIERWFLHQRSRVVNQDPTECAPTAGLRPRGRGSGRTRTALKASGQIDVVTKEVAG